MCWKLWIINGLAGYGKIAEFSIIRFIDLENWLEITDWSHDWYLVLGSMVTTWYLILGTWVNYSKWRLFYSLKSKDKNNSFDWSSQVSVCFKSIYNTYYISHVSITYTVIPISYWSIFFLFLNKNFTPLSSLKALRLSNFNHSILAILSICIILFYNLMIFSIKKRSFEWHC